MLHSGTNFFTTLADSMGRFICMDESTAEGSNFDTARIMVRVRLDHTLVRKVLVQIERKGFTLFLKEDVIGIMRSIQGTCKSSISSSESAESEDEWSVNDLDVTDDIVAIPSECKVDADIVV